MASLITCLRVFESVKKGSFETNADARSKTVNAVWRSV